MSRHGWASTLKAGTALGILIIATAQANAGAFAIREQSTYGQGTSFAGVAAGGSLSSMFWNPATMTQFPGVVSENGLSAILPHVSQTPLPGSTLAGSPFFFRGVSNSGDQALVPNGYTSLQIRPNLWLGLAINSPFGLAVSFQEPWAGRNFGLDTTIKSYNLNPNIAYRINDWISVGVGVQAQYASAQYAFGLSPGFPTPLSSGILEGKGWGFGATAGVTFTPWASTTIGLGWRSAINQDLRGSLTLPPGLASASTDFTVNLPDVASLGIRHSFDSRWTVMGTVEWSHWSRIGTVNVNSVNGGPALIGATPLSIPLRYDDGWFFSAGAEYRWTDRLTVRGGVGYEISPISDQVRTTRLPDNDKFWASVGLSWAIAPFMRFDLAYTHLFVRDTNVNITAASGNPNFNPVTGIAYIGTADSHADIISAAFVVKLDQLVTPTAKPLITK